MGIAKVCFPLEPQVLQKTLAPMIAVSNRCADPLYLQLVEGVIEHRPKKPAL